MRQLTCFCHWLCLLVFFSGSNLGWAQSHTYPFPTTSKSLHLQPAWIDKYQTATYFGTVSNPNPTDTTVYFCFKRVDKAVLFRREGTAWSRVDSTGEVLSQNAIYPDRQAVRLTLQEGAETSFRLDVSNYFEQQYQPTVQLCSAQNYSTLRVQQVTTQAQEKTKQYIFIGILLMMFVYALIQALLHTTPRHTWYMAYVGCTLCLFLLRFEVIVPEQWGFGRAVNFVGKYSVTFFSSGMIAYLLFIQAFTQVNNRFINRILWGFIFPLNAAIAVVDVFYTVEKYIDNQEFVFFRVVELIDTITFIGTGYLLVKLKTKANRLLLAGVATLLFSALLQQGLIWYFQDRTLYRHWISINWQIGISVELAFFLAALAYRNRQTEREKSIIQIQLIEQLRENQTKQARLNGLRDEIARDLHDEMGSQLSSISILSQTTTRYVTDERVRQRLTAIGQTARQVMESMREIVWSLNTTGDSLQNVGLRIRETALALFDDSHVTLRFDLPGTAEPLDLTGPQRRELFLIAKESLTNILRHARATTVWIDLHQEPGALRLSIRDNGRGFDPTLEQSGLGLSSLQTRAGRLSATLTITSAPARGTHIELNCTECVGRDMTPVEQAELSLV